MLPFAKILKNYFYFARYFLQNFCLFSYFAHRIRNHIDTLKHQNGGESPEETNNWRDNRMEQESESVATTSYPSKLSKLVCHVCESPTANTLHFGGRSCKACAAFFRRTVSMSMTYECIGTREEYKKCNINHELRMLCRHCRFVKCTVAGMKPDLVQAKKEEIKVAKRRSRGLVRNVESNTTKNSTYEDYVQSYVTNNESSEINDNPQSEPEINVKTETSITRESTPNSQIVVHEVMDFSDLNQFSQIMMPVVTSVPPIDPRQPSTSFTSIAYIPSPYVNISVIRDAKVFELLNVYMKMETSLSDRRRIMYTKTKIMDIFDVYCECPYERSDLKPFDFRTFCGFVKHDFIMLLDFVSGFPEFSQLSKIDKSAFYRMASAVDSMISSAYYTYRTGIDENLLVLFNGDYIKMDPRPMSGDEPDAEKHFESRADHTIYKTVMPLKLSQYFEMAIPFSKLQISFEEFVLLKALIIWQVSNYKLTDHGRSICARQRDEIVRALHRTVEERGDEDPAIRVGQLMLNMSYIMEQVHAMTHSYIMLTFFDVVSCDSVMHDLLFR